LYKLNVKAWDLRHIALGEIPQSLAAIQPTSFLFVALSNGPMNAMLILWDPPKRSRPTCWKPVSAV
jgi:hypothetical protein